MFFNGVSLCCICLFICSSFCVSLRCNIIVSICVVLSLSLSLSLSIGALGHPLPRGAGDETQAILSLVKRPGMKPDTFGEGPPPPAKCVYMLYKCMMCFVYIYIYMHMYTHTHTYTYTYTYTCIYTKHVHIMR